MEAIEIAAAAAAIGARVSGEPAGAFTAICTDTRRGAADSLFFALRGENADGHRFVAGAVAAGARAVVVDHPLPDIAATQLVVPDVLTALSDLARYHRLRYDIPVVGVTGSVGKTSTREMIAAALRARWRTHTNERNFNNEIGVPLTLFGLAPEHQAAVLEMAMRGPGQIADLARIVAPRVGVITNIGLSHIELLGSRDAIAAAKGELLDFLPADGTAVLNADDAYCAALRARARCRVVTYGTVEGADFRVTDVEFDSAGAPSFRVDGVTVRLNAPGVHHVMNAAAAVAVANALGISTAEAVVALEHFEAPAMRMETVEAPHGMTVLNDAYNAAPDSMRAALETLAVMARDGRRSVAILGDMKELGSHSEEAHRFVGQSAAELGIGLVVTVGGEAAATARAAEEQLGSERVVCFETTEQATNRVRALAQKGDVVLVKGSRAMEMERIVAALKDEH